MTVKRTRVFVFASYLLVLASCDGSESAHTDNHAPQAPHASPITRHSFEQALLPEDISEATVVVHHFADELDAFANDYYETTTKGVVLGIEGAHYAIFVSRCGIDFSWPNHEVRWRGIHGAEDGSPEITNEGFLVAPESQTSADVAIAAANAAEHRVVDSPPGGRFEQVSASHMERIRRREALPDSRAAHGVARTFVLTEGHGSMSDIGILLVPTSYFERQPLKTLGFEQPTKALNTLVQNHGTLVGIPFEFTCPDCAHVVKTYQSREIAAFGTGVIVGIVAGQFLSAFLQDARQVDASLARNAAELPHIDPKRRIANAGLKRLMLERDGYRCFYAKFDMCDPATCWACVAANFHADHVVPWVDGGSTTLDNLVTACAACNLSKGASTLFEWVRKSEQTR